MLVDISDIKKDLNEEEKEIFDKVIKAMNTKSITVNMLNLAFAVILLYVCFTILPLWAAISLIGIKLAIPIAELVKYIIIAKKLIKDDKDAKKNIIYLKQKSISRDGQKVIIDNSRGLRLGFFIFFIFKLLCVHKDEKQIFYICTETRNSDNCLPRLEFRI